MKSQAELKGEAKALVAKLELSGANAELRRKLKPLIEQTHLQAGDHAKLAVLLGYSV